MNPRRAHHDRLGAVQTSAPYVEPLRELGGAAQAATRPRGRYDCAVNGALAEAARIAAALAKGSNDAED